MRNILLILGSILILISISCAARVTPAPEIKAPELSEKPTTMMEPREAWEREWEKLLLIAKKEGRVVLYGSPAPQEREAIVEAFRKKNWGFMIDWVSGPAGAMQAKLIQEKRAGLTLADVVISGSSTSVRYKQYGVIDPFIPELILPEVKDPKKWFSDELPFMDKEKLIFQALNNYGSGIDKVWINTNYVKMEEIKTYQDLLNPKWKGKIATEDPTTAGSFANWVALGYEALGEDYFKALVKNIGAVTRDRNVIADWLVKGRYHITISGASEVFRKYQKVGSPI